METDKRYMLKITGVVQGVGFRPFIYSLARSLSLRGWVNNTSSAVIVDLEGPQEVLEEFVRKVRCEAPPLSTIKDIDISESSYVGYTEFTIKESTVSKEQSVYISPDFSTCSDCERELFDKSNPRYLYPFINCTNCGPRFTIVTGVPYDRVNTTMSKFPMCESCRNEYTDPMDRRYHAQPVSCYACGPRLTLLDSKGEVVKEMSGLEAAADISTIANTQFLLSKGNIIAVKGLGGYHLACDAKNEAAVRRLRKRKIRDDKPFAVMARDYAAALSMCHINEKESELLKSNKKPIVLLEKREGFDLPHEIAPNNPYLGIMLPYTPLHMLLFHDISSEFAADCPKPAEIPELLVMTSGNRSSEPIYYRDEDAVENLKDIADYFLTNDRDIFIRTDDSVTRVFRNSEYIIRRSRGYAPMPLLLDMITAIGSEKNSIPKVLACGGELKNTFCMSRDNEFFVSHHIGDLENFETLGSFEEGIEYYKKLFNISHEIVAYDLHPEYLSTKYALSLSTDKKIAVQHHHAHIASCMAENGLNENVIGVAFDGTGYGEDGHIWGGEFFTGGYGDFKRAGHLEYIPMPGAEAAINEPWRMAVSYLNKTYTNTELLNNSNFGIRIGKAVLLRDVGVDKINVVNQMIAKKINSPVTSSMGRLFDAVSALLGVRSRINYEGQAAVELELLADKGCHGEYDFIINKAREDEVFSIDVRPVIKGIIYDLEKDVSPAVIAARFHETAASIVLDGCRKAREASGLEKVVLSGGVFQNLTLLEKSMQKLQNDGFAVYIHSRIPANDAGISLGQAVIAVYRTLIV